eukprot:scaffold2299_cov131-Cylindrotheca_fusiformis.AAC.26
MHRICSILDQGNIEVNKKRQPTTHTSTKTHHPNSVRRMTHKLHTDLRHASTFEEKRDGRMQDISTFKGESSSHGLPPSTNARTMEWSIAYKKQTLNYNTDEYSGYFALCSR